MKGIAERLIKILDEAVLPSIEETLLEIGQDYIPGLVEWVRANQPQTWTEIQQIEEAINASTLSGDTFGLRQALNQYREAWSRMIRRSSGQKKFV